MIVSSFENGIEDFDHHGCSDRLRWWIADMSNNFSVVGWTPLPLDLSVFQSPPFMDAKGGKKKVEKRVVAPKGSVPEGDVSKPSGDIEMKDGTGPTAANRGKSGAEGVRTGVDRARVDNEKGKRVVRPKPHGVGKGGGGVAAPEHGQQPKVDQTGPRMGGRPKQTPFPPRWVDESGAQSSGPQGGGSRQAGGDLLTDDAMSVDGGPKKRKTPQRDSDEEEEREESAEESIRSKKRKVMNPIVEKANTTKEATDGNNGDEGVSAGLSGKGLVNDGVDRRVVTVNGVAHFVVPCSTWCLTNDKPCVTGAGPTIACDRCHKARQSCEKSVKKGKGSERR